MIFLVKCVYVHPYVYTYVYYLYIHESVQQRRAYDDVTYVHDDATYVCHIHASVQHRRARAAR